MTSPNNKDRELQRREHDLIQRERELRLRELEAEINQPPLYQTVKHEQPEGRLQRWKRKLVMIGKFIVFVVGTVVVVRLSFAIAMIMIAGVIGFIGYKLFLEGDGKKS
ncbi:MAG: hypothetical protein RLP02_31440 [Coleofasciculus sp. C2-GNP5-27]|jgi:hypothetical protein|uniref:hypothetical protein n=1 Tax=Coleofasciculus sp. C1-SOL-03 TaxID=3069522 RepID=UPI0033006FFC